MIAENEKLHYFMLIIMVYITFKYNDKLAIGFNCYFIGILHA